MELKDLSGFVLLVILVGMMLSMGVLIFDKFGTATFYTTGINDTVNPGNASVSIELTGGNLTDPVVSAVYNSTGIELATTLYIIRENATDGNRAYFNVTDTNNESMTTDVWVVYDYKNFNTQTQTTSNAMRTEVGNISSNWIGLIITVAILSLILILVIGSFGSRT